MCVSICNVSVSLQCMCLFVMCVSICSNPAGFEVSVLRKDRAEKIERGQESANSNNRTMNQPVIGIQIMPSLCLFFFLCLGLRAQRQYRKGLIVSAGSNQPILPAPTCH